MITRQIMKINKRKQILNRNNLLIIAAVLSVLLIAFGLSETFGLTHIIHREDTKTTDSGNSTKIDTNPPTQEQIDAGNAIKSGESNDTPVSPTTVEGSNKKSVQLLITAANQNNPYLQIGVQIDTVTSAGTCTLTLTNSHNETITKTAGVQALARTSTCKGFNVPVSELSTGNWHIKVIYSSDTLTGEATVDKMVE